MIPGNDPPAPATAAATTARGARGAVAALSLLVGGFLAASRPVQIPSGGTAPDWLRGSARTFDLDEERDDFLRVSGGLSRGARSAAREAMGLARTLLERGDARGAVVIGEAEEGPSAGPGIVIEAAAEQDGYFRAVSWIRIAADPAGARVLRVSLYERSDFFSFNTKWTVERVLPPRWPRTGSPTLLDRFRSLFPRKRKFVLLAIERDDSPLVRVERASMPPPTRDALLLVARDLIDAREDLAVLPPWCLRAHRNEWADVRIRTGTEVEFEQATPTLPRSGTRLRERKVQALADLVEIATRDLPFRPCAAVDEDLDWIARRRARGKTAEGFEEARAELLELIEKIR